MYAAAFEMSSWLGVQEYVFEGESLEEIMSRFEQVQDLGCLVRMGRSEENAAGQKQLDKLEAFLEKYYEGNLTPEDIKTLNVKISIGAFRCLGIAEGEEEIDALRQKYPGAN